MNGELLPAAVSMGSVAQRRAVQYVHQDPRATFLDHRSVLDQVARLAVLLRGEDQESVRAVAAQLLEDLGLDPATCARGATTLSGGQLQRAAVARALASQPAVLVCDEVTSALDGDKKQELLHALDRVRNDHATTVVLISHDLPLVAQVSDRVAMIEDGRLRWTQQR
ncbi:ATP-binding cassette domain-containing protein [Pseudonocardia sp. T1-2H]|uniref:ATP-binding cassette domain-containing protein n=1 Tax=Pseudonocardia sp. T1-2H TaxID=3128899 RepID=UPI0031010E2C